MVSPKPRWIFSGHLAQCPTAPPAPGCLKLAQPVLPSHLPPRPASLFGKTALGGRRRSRRSARRVAWILCELFWCHLSCHEIGDVKHRSSFETRFGPYSISAEPHIQLLSLHDEFSRLCRLAPVVSRGTQALQSHIESLEVQLLSSSSVNQTIARLAGSVAHQWCSRPL